MKRTRIAVLCLSVMALAGCDSKEVKTVQQTIAVTQSGEDTGKSWDTVLSHRAVCDSMSWSYEKYGDADAVVYRCEFKDQDVQLMKAYSQYLLGASVLKREVNDLKLELEEIAQQEKQMEGLKNALQEMSNNGLANLYSLLADAIGVGYVDYEALLNGQHVMKKLEPNEKEKEIELNPSLHESYLNLFLSKLDEVKATLERHGVDAKAVTGLGLYRSKLENSDYLRMSREDRDEYINYDTALFKERRESILDDIKYRENLQKQKETSTPPTLKSMEQKIVFDATPGAVKPIYCGITYHLNGEESAQTVDDDFSACLQRGLAQTWNDDFTALFNRMLPN